MTIPVPAGASGPRKLITRPTVGFERWDLVKVPYPHTDRPIRERRPALVVAAGSLTESLGLLWV